MKNFFLVLIYWSCSLIYAYGQEVSKVTEIQMVFPNVTYRDFLVENPHIQSLLIEYREGKSVSLTVYYHASDDKYMPDELYDLTFEGDLYRLEKRYKPFDFLSYPKIGVINEAVSIKP